ncbi:MAG: ATP synthase subunit I [Planctomycetota bacterium]|jgi:F1F0 ATPase subunit 2|nr:ATP synthase subunit I [Planctomycetota bacterium]
MRVFLDLFPPWLVGFALGLFFFGGLWWTVRRGLASKHAALWFAGSLLLRLAVALTGLYWLAGGRWERLLACMLGFFVARRLVTRLVGRAISPAAPAPGEDVHAP